MHAEAIEYVKRWATPDWSRVLDIGGRDINGTPRPWFPGADYTSVDLRSGPGVDLVGDVLALELPYDYYDLVLCLEVLEHVHRWEVMIGRAYALCRHGGRLVVTCAGPGRAVHSGIDGSAKLHAGEWYGNIDPVRLVKILQAAGFQAIEVDLRGNDLQATGTKSP